MDDFNYERDDIWEAYNLFVIKYDNFVHRIEDKSIGFLERYLKRFILACDRKNIMYEITASGECQFPLCVLDKVMDLADIKNHSHAHGSEEDFYKNDLCKKCSYDKFCNGFRREYVEKYGDEEIEPILPEK